MTFIRLALLLIPCQLAYGALQIEITEGTDNAVRVAVVPFAVKGIAQGHDVTRIIGFDLSLSGRFETLAEEQMLSLPNTSNEVFPRDWRKLRVEYLILGQLEPSGNKLRLTFELYNVFKQSVEVKQSIEGSRDQIRDMAHYVSDVVFEQLTGIRGAFSTQIMYVIASGPLENRTFKLHIADVDGARVKTILESKEPILSAGWSPDSKKITYVSFEEDQKPAIYIENLVTGSRERMPTYHGLNSAPAFSPDGKQLALVLSKDGNPDIYTLDLDTRNLHRITRHYGIDTEPSWRPDGQAIIFTSSRGGQPQIYQITLADLAIERLTFEGDYNAMASLLPNGDGLVMVHRRDGIFHIALLDLVRGHLKTLTKTSLDESPSVAPNGSMLIYATQLRGKGILAVVSIDNRVKFNLPSNEGDVREPAWSPGKRVSFTPKTY